MKILDTYNFIGICRLLRDLVITKIFFKECRIIRPPFYIRGSKGIDYGQELTTGVGLRIDVLNFETGQEKNLKLGKEFN